MHLLYLFRLLGGGLLVGISGMACCCQARHEPAPTGVPQTSLRPAMQCTVNSELQCFGEIEAATNLDAKQCSALDCAVQRSLCKCIRGTQSCDLWVGGHSVCCVSDLLFQMNRYKSGDFCLGCIFSCTTRSAKYEASSYFGFLVSSHRMAF